MSARRSSVAHSLTGRPSWLPDSSQHDSAGVPPAIRTYLYEQEHGTFRRYLLEACVVLGVFLPWVAPLIGLCAIAPIVQLALLDSRVITPSADCYGPEGGVCNNEVYFDYYFWNITNPVEWLAGAAAPALQEIGPYTFRNQEYRYGVTYTPDYYTVNYTSHNFQTFLANESCAGCTLDDNFITVNRAYLAVIQAYKAEVVLLMSSVPLALNQILEGYAQGLEAAGIPAAAAPQYAIKQWATCTIFPAATHTEFCDWALRVQHVPAPYNQLDVSLATTLLGSFTGNISKYTPTAPDPAASQACLGFAFTPAAQLAAAYQLPNTTVQLVQGYLIWVAQNLVGPTFAADVLGAPLDPASGGLVVKRPLQQWLYGFTDPLLALQYGPTAPAAKVSLTYAFPTQDAPLAAYGLENFTDLGPLISPLIHQPTLATGKAAHADPTSVREYNGDANVTGYPHIAFPVQGVPFNNASYQGLLFAPNTHPSDNVSLWSFDLIWDRVVAAQGTGQRINVKGVVSDQWGISPASLAACGDQQADETRCSYPDSIAGTFNQSLTYQCPTLLSLPHFMQVDPSLPESTGHTFSPNSSLHGWTFEVEARTGFTVSGSKGYQTAHLVRRTDTFYPNLWVNASSNTGGLWLPTFWARSRFVMLDSAARSLRSAIKVKTSMKLVTAIIAPCLGGIFLILGVYGLFLAPGCKERRAVMNTLTETRARKHRLNKLELARMQRLQDEALETKQAMEEADANTFDGAALHGYRSPVGTSAAVTPRGEERGLLDAGQEPSVTKL